MRWWFCVPGALVPAEMARHAVKALPDEIVRVFCKSDVDETEAFPESAAPHLDWLWQRFGGKGAPVTAPYLWSMSSKEPPAADAMLWCCDPVHFAFARDHMLVTPLDDSVSTRDVSALMQVAAAVATREAASITEQNGVWFLRTESAWQLTTTPLDGALGRSLTDCWPEGADARRWRRLLNEIQVEWHRHPINEEQTERGFPEVNGLWLHGGGVSPPLAGRTFASLVCDDSRLNAWAHAAGMPRERRMSNEATPPADGDAVTLITDLLPAFNAEDWSGWMSRWTAFTSSVSAQIARVHAAGFDLTLQMFGDSHSRAITLGANDRWRIWRGADRARAAALLTETRK